MKGKQIIIQIVFEKIILFKFFIILKFIFLLSDYEEAEEDNLIIEDEEIPVDEPESGEDLEENI